MHWAEIEKSGIGAAVFGAPLSAAVQHLPTILLSSLDRRRNPFFLIDEVRVGRQFPQYVKAGAIRLQ